MKSKFTFLLFAICVTIGHAQSVTDYYWSGKKKIFFTADSNNFTVIPREKTFKASVLQRLRGNPDIFRIEQSDGSILVSVALKKPSKASIGKIQDLITSQADMIRVNRVNGITPIIFTGEIIFQLKKNVSLEKVVNFTKRRVDFVEQKYNMFIVRSKNMDESVEIANQIYESGLVEWCHPNFWAEIVKFQNDPQYPDQYYLNNTGQGGGVANMDINAPEAWAISRGLNNVRVAIIDDGVENHEDINGRVLQGFTSRNPNGFGTPVNPAPDPALGAIIGHGQACAGIVAATQNNSLGVAGIAQCSQIVPVNIFSDWFLEFDPQLGRQRVRFRETALDIATAINWAWNEGGADVLSNSWGYPTSNAGQIQNADAIVQSITNARTNGRNGRGSVVVFASGNSNQQFGGVTFPANTNGVITVGAIDHNGNIWNYSSRGNEMDLVAPSGNLNNQGDVWTTDRANGNGYVAGNYVGTFGGTSAACPQVSGAAALMLSVRPDLTEEQVRNILRNTATDMGTAGFDNTFGSGRLNIAAAMRSILQTISGPERVCSSSAFTVANLPAGLVVTWTSSNTSGLTINNSGVATRVGGFNGTVTVTASIATGCGNATVSRNVNVDNAVPPTPNDIVGFNTVLGVSPGQLLELEAPITNMPSYQWSVQGGTIRGNANQYFVLIEVNRCKANRPNPSINVNLAYKNACGTSLTYTEFTTVVCGTGGGALAVYPNPADGQMSIALVQDNEQKQDGQTTSQAAVQAVTTDKQAVDAQDADAQSNSEADVILSDAAVRLVNRYNQTLWQGRLKQGKASVPTASIPDGLYYLIIEGEQPVTKQIIIRH